MDAFFSADDIQECLELLFQSVSKHALDFLFWCRMRKHAHVVVFPCQERSLARTFHRRSLQFSVKVGRNLWQELPFLSDGRTERFGVTHEKFVKLSVFSVYYLSSDPIDASFNQALRQ